MKSINKITLINVVSTILLQGLAFFTAPLFSRLLGTNDYGIFNVYKTWVSIASTVLTLQAASTIANARTSFDLTKQEEYQSSVMSMAIIIYIFFSVAIFPFAFFISRYFKANVLFIPCVLLQGIGMYLVNILNSKLTYEFKAGKNLFVTLAVSVGNVIFSLLFIFLLGTQEKYWGKILGEVVVYFSAGMIGYLIILKNGKSFYVKEYWKFTLPIAFPTVFHLLANLVLAQSDRLMLQRLIGNSAVGIYSLAAVFSSVISTIYGSLNNTWVPFYFELTKKDCIEEIKEHTKNYIQIFTILCCGFVLLTREVYRIIADEAYWSGINYIIIFTMGLYMVFLYSFPVNYEFYHKKTSIIAKGTILAAGCNIALNYVFIKTFGTIGAVFATSLSYGFQFIFHYFNAKKIQEGIFPYNILMFIPGMVIVFFACVISIAVQDFFMIRWGLGIVLGIDMVWSVYKRKSLF